MHPIPPLDRSSPALPARTGGATGDAFALLLDRIGGEDGDGDAPRQGAAPGGKRLPVAAIDPALILPPMVAQPIDAPPPPAPVPAPPPQGVRAAAVPAAASDAALPDDVVAQLQRLAADPNRPAVPDDVAGHAASAAQDVQTAPDTDEEAGGSRPADPAPAIRRPLPGEHAAPVVVLAPPRAADPVVAALAQATERDDPRDTPAIDRPGEPSALPFVAADLAPRPVAATNGAEAPRPDLRDDAAMQAMIDHIETLRDAGGTTAETRIRLSPDALGSVEVVLHRTDAGVEVRFASDNAAAAQALADAQPRLAELAQQRGVRLGAMQVDVGGGRDAPRHDRQPSAGRPPRIAATRAPGTESATDDSRIA